MKCKNHPDRDAEGTCANCKYPFCNQCIVEIQPGTYYCRECVWSALRQADKDDKPGFFHAWKRVFWRGAWYWWATLIFTFTVSLVFFIPYFIFGLFMMMSAGGN